MQQFNALSINISQSTEIKDENQSFSSLSSNIPPSDDFSKLMDEQLTENEMLLIKKQLSSEDETVEYLENKTEQGNNNKPLKRIPEQALINEVLNDAVESDVEKQHVVDDLTKKTSITENPAKKQQEVATIGNNTQVIVADTALEQVDLSGAEQLMAFFVKADTTPTHLVVNDELTTRSALDLIQEKKSFLPFKSESTSSNSVDILPEGKDITLSVESTINPADKLKGIAPDEVTNNKIQNDPLKAKPLTGHQQSEVKLSTEKMAVEAISSVLQYEEATQEKTARITPDIKPEITETLKSSDEKKAKNINDKVIFESITPEKIVDRKDLGTTKKIEEQVTIDSVSVKMKQTQPITIPMATNQKDQAQLSNENMDELSAKQVIDAQMNKEHLTEKIPSKEIPKFDVKLEQEKNDFSKNSDFINVTGKATQAAQDFAEQSSANILNASINTEVIQNQKSNIQLHQETIAIFRKDFTEAVKDKVMLMISQKLQQFDITLDPPELGNMHVRVNLQGEQAVVNFMVQNPQAKEALEQNMHKLREMLAEQGVDVGDANVEQHSQQENDKNTAENQHNGNQVNTVEASDAIEHTFSAQVLKSSNSAIDYYA